MNYEELGLKVGIEVHRQLDTRRKLFCHCATTPAHIGEEVEFVRSLREAQSELGQVDPAARFEQRRKRRVRYRAHLSDVCLVEMDEEPPHMISQEAVNVALTVSALLGANPVDEIHVMRKIVIDGSNTTGFQRTCVIAIGGEVRVDGLRVPIETITLEEDAARIVEARPGEVLYDLSRLGIPLIEISTAPVIHSPRDAVSVAKAIGRILRATRKVKRGLGTVRQDLNISIEGGGLAEVKGVQELELIASVIDYEARRQHYLKLLIEELKERGASRREVESQEIMDVTEIFASTGSKVISRMLSAGGRVKALRLPRFAGLLRGQGSGDIRLGRELAEYAKAWGEVEGIFHSDELPGYGITREEVEAVRRILGASEGDAFVIVADAEQKAIEALEAVRQRAAEATERVPEETRAPRPDGSTVYMRPRPGSARMYPETDIPPLILGEELVAAIRRSLPPTLEEVAENLSRQYGLSKQLISELIDEDRIEDFERLARTGVSPSFVASFLTETFKELRREGYMVDDVDLNEVERLFWMISRGETAKESAREVLAYLSKNRGAGAEEAISILGLRAPPMDEVVATIDRLIESVGGSDQAEKVHMSRLMGELMGLYRGRVDGALLNKLLRERMLRQREHRS